MPDILTKREVEELKQHVDDEGCFVDVDLDRVARTIEAMAKLLERYTRTPRDEEWELEQETLALLATYHGTKGGDDDGK